MHANQVKKESCHMSYVYPFIPTNQEHNGLAHEAQRLPLIFLQYIRTQNRKLKVEIPLNWT